MNATDACTRSAFIAAAALQILMARYTASISANVDVSVPPRGDAVPPQLCRLRSLRSSRRTL